MVENVAEIDLWMIIGGRSNRLECLVKLDRVELSLELWLKHWWDDLLNLWQSWWQCRNRGVDIHVEQLSLRSSLIFHYFLAWLTENSTHHVKIWRFCCWIWFDSSCPTKWLRRERFNCNFEDKNVEFLIKFTLNLIWVKIIIQNAILTTKFMESIKHQKNPENTHQMHTTLLLVIRQKPLLKK